MRYKLHHSNIVMTANKIMTPKTKRQFANPPKMNRMARQSSLQLLIRLERAIACGFTTRRNCRHTHTYAKERRVHRGDNNRDNSNIGKFGANIPIILLIIKWPSILGVNVVRALLK